MGTRCSNTNVMVCVNLLQHDSSQMAKFSVSSRLMLHKTMNRMRSCFNNRELKTDTGNVFLIITEIAQTELLLY
jgi:CRISPR/Cas system-associated protein endoribonuclease Cas2